MSWKADEVIRYPNGTTEHIRWRKTPRHRTVRSRLRRVYDEDGQLESIWYEVLDANDQVIHAERMQ